MPLILKPSKPKVCNRKQSVDIRFWKTKVYKIMHLHRARKCPYDAMFMFTQSKYENLEI